MNKKTTTDIITELAEHIILFKNITFSDNTNFLSSFFLDNLSILAQIPTA